MNPVSSPTYTVDQSNDARLRATDLTGTSTMMKNTRKIKFEQNLQYNLTIWKNHAFDILNDISEDLTLVQLMDSLGNVNHDISIVGHWIFDSNYEKSLCLTQ